MQTTPFHAYYKAKKINLENKLLPAYVSGAINIYPYQVAAASFALGSPFRQGVILADEGSLGKTYEALIIISQKWFDGVRKILIVVPSHLLAQWEQVESNNFFIPYQCVVDSSEITIEDGITLTTYDNCESCFMNNEFEVTCFDEAQRLRRDNDTNSKIKLAVKNSYKILLTPAPIMNDIMDIYHLINFIDEEEFPDADEYYNRYFRQEDNYAELSGRVSKYVFRTLKSQVSGYVNIPNRLVATLKIKPTTDELLLHDKVVEYANRSFKKAYPKMGNYDLMLMLTGILSSSTFAFEETMENLIKRIENDEVDDWECKELNDILLLTSKIKKNSKMQILLTLLPQLFKQLKVNGANKKAVIFVRNRTTIKALNEILKEKFKTVTFDGSKSRRYDIIEKFKNEVQVLITTDIANEGLNLEFCSCVINFDMSYNTLDIEQRILRCHRQNQLNDVLAINFINSQNANDIRSLELYKKRLRQFAGIFGISDEILGDFYDEQGIIKYYSENSRNQNDIKSEFDDKIKNIEKENTQLSDESKTVLFSTFNPKISQSATLTPEYVETKRIELNTGLWYATTSLLENQSGITLNHETRTIKAMNGYGESPLFKTLYIRRNDYSMTDTTLPKSGRYNLAAPLAQNVIREIISRKTTENGDVDIENAEPCKIELYEIAVKKGFSYWATSYEFVELIGKTQSGEILSDKQCQNILSLEHNGYREIGEKLTWQQRLDYKYPKGDFQDLIDTDKYRDIAISGAELIEKDAVERIKRKEYNKKFEIDLILKELMKTKQDLENQEEQITTVYDRIKLDKKLAIIEDDLKKSEISLFMDRMRAEYETEQNIKSILEDKNISVEIKRIFKINVV